MLRLQNNRAWVEMDTRDIERERDAALLRSMTPDKINKFLEQHFAQLGAGDDKALAEIDRIRQLLGLEWQDFSLSVPYSRLLAATAPRIAPEALQAFERSVIAEALETQTVRMIIEK
jgi:hypothetical protein